MFSPPFCRYYEDAEQPSLPTDLLEMPHQEAPSSLSNQAPTAPRQPRITETESRLKDYYLLSVPSTATEAEPTPAQNTPQTPEQLQIISHIESLSLAHINAVNSHNYDITSPAWSNLSSTFLSDVRSVCMKYPRRLTRDEYVAHYRWLISLYPDYHLEPQAVSTELKVLTRGITRGEVTLTLENRGNPPGVVRTIVCLMEWKKEGVDGEWECVALKAVRGPEV